MLKKALKTLGKALDDKAFPGGQIAVFANGDSYAECFGCLDWAPSSAPVTPDVMYDLASVTKVVGTAAVCMRLVQQSRLSLDERIGDMLDGFADPRLSEATVRRLLSHTAGLPAWKPLFRSVTFDEMRGPVARGKILDLLKNMKLEYEPGTKAIYSDLDMMLLGYAIESREEKSLGDLANQLVFRPLGMAQIGFRPTVEFPQSKSAPTENCTWRNRLLIGEVDDENTFAAGGMAGQAGLFATADSLLIFCRELLDALDGAGKLFSEQIVREFITRAMPEKDCSFCLGFDGKSPRGSRLPDAFGSNSFGHWGFTGTGLWMDPDRRTAVALLTNRVHPSRENDRIRNWRPLIMGAAVDPKY
jgi:serine-type D-Ala-D-Ala carboxypeptidase